MAPHERLAVFTDRPALADATSIHHFVGSASCLDHPGVGLCYLASPCRCSPACPQNESPHSHPPVGLTFLFQVLDTYVYADLKRRIRRGIIRKMVSSVGGQVERLARIRCIGLAVHDAMVGVDCREYFRRVGLAEDFDALSDDVSQLVQGQNIAPALPLRAEFATMVGRPSHTRVTGVLHSLIMSDWFDLRSLPVEAGAPLGAHVEVAEQSPARRRGRDLPEDRPVLWDDVRMASPRRLEQDRSVVVSPMEEAVNVFLDM